jgi:hypothetical protein
MASNPNWSNQDVHLQIITAGIEEEGKKFFFLAI